MISSHLLAAPAVLLLPMLEDDDLLDGVPDDAPAVTDADLLDDDASRTCSVRRGRVGDTEDAIGEAPSARPRLDLG